MLKLAAAAAAAAAVAQPAGPGSPYVWLLHGSGGGGGIGGWASSEVPVGATVPGGLLRLGPDTTTCWEGGDYWWYWNHYGGYWAEAEGEACVRAFSHSHLQGAGLGDGGSLGLAVARYSMTGASPPPIPGPLNMSPYRSTFSHATEQGAPGFYSVLLNSSATLAEVTVAGRTSGLHRYTCGALPGAPGEHPCVLHLDACHRNHDNSCGAGSIALLDSGSAAGGLTVAAELTLNGSFGQDCGGVPIYLAAVITAEAANGSSSSAPLRASALGRWADGALRPGQGAANSSGASGSLGAWASWDAPVTILVRVGVSYVSQAKALANLQAEQAQAQAQPGGAWVGFEDARARAAGAWAAAIDTIVVNDVGYTAADALRTQQRGAAQGEDSAWAALHSVPGRAPSAQGAARARAQAERAAEAWWRASASPPAAAAARSSSSSSSGALLPRAWVARSGLGANASGQAIVAALEAAEAAVRSGSGGSSSRSGSSTPGSLPPRTLRAMPPAERLGSFYSSFYHALSAPTAYNDVDGAFAGLRGTSGNSTSSWGGNYLSDLSLWDVYRSQTPLLAVLAPRAARDLHYTFAAMFNASGVPPHWVFASCETGVMPGSHGLGVLADFLVKGVPGPGVSVAMAAAAAGLARQEGAEWTALGFVPLETHQNGASLTLDFAFDDACGAVIAELAGNASQAAAWAARAQNYKNVFLASNPQGGAMCPKYRNGSFLEPCPPLDLPPVLLCPWYTEGNGLQYTFSVPHDAEGLLALYPAPADFVALLQQQMANTSLWPVAALPNPWYWAGNEPNVLAPWLFSLLNTEAWRTQYWVRWVLDTYYQLAVDGVPGNDDFGELNSWAVWACLGLYPMTATRTGRYILSSPCFANVTLQLPLAEARLAGYAHAAAASAGPAVPLLTIVAHNFSASNVYVARAALNGAPLATPFVTHAELMPPLLEPRLGEDAGAHAARRAQAGAGGSLLEYWLTDAPVVWGTGEPAQPPKW